MTRTGFGLGCPALGNLYRAISDEVAQATVHAAWDAGIRYFDTAPHDGPVPAAVLRRAQALAARCTHHGSTLPAAALAFVGGHPSGACVLLGAQTPAELARAACLPPPPPALWPDLIGAGLVRADAPVPPW